MFNLLNYLFPFSDFLYILQLEEYETRRYLKTVRRLWWKRNLQKRGKLVWTKRVKIIFFLALPFGVLIPPMIPFLVGLSNFLLTPYFEWIKKSIQKKAMRFFSEKGKGTKVIAIAGSFGKTTTKNYIYELVRYNYKTTMIPGNINTPTGIANWILNHFESATELLIVEVDSYFIGEIKRSLRITPPDIAILTNIGDQHLERLGTRANLRKALLEIFEYAKPDAIKIRDKKNNLAYALLVAKTLKIPRDIAKDTVQSLEKPERRGDIKLMHGFEVIDESYNISETTAKYAIDDALKLVKAKNKKLIVVTAGIPELGEENMDANKNLGEFLVRKAKKSNFT